MIDPQPSPADESAAPAGSTVPTPAAVASQATGPLVLLGADDALACVDELCLPAEATR
jgi:hypothetical protein